MMSTFKETLQLGLIAAAALVAIIFAAISAVPHDTSTVVHHHPVPVVHQQPAPLAPVAPRPQPSLKVPVTPGLPWLPYGQLGVLA